MRGLLHLHLLLVLPFLVHGVPAPHSEEDSSGGGWPMQPMQLMDIQQDIESEGQTAQV